MATPAHTAPGGPVPTDGDLRASVPIALAAAGGAAVALLTLPAWLPGLQASLAGAEPKAFWYLSRASGLTAFGLMWLSMLLGLLVTNKLARLWPGGPTAFALHQHASLLGLGFAGFHGLVLLGDRYQQFTPMQLLVPFAVAGYRPFWVGVGQVAFYFLALVAMSFFVRKSIGQRRWRLLHFLSFLGFGLSLVHGVTSGTDGVAWLYWSAGASVLLLTFNRLLTWRAGSPKRADSPPPTDRTRPPGSEAGVAAGTTA